MAAEFGFGILEKEVIRRDLKWIGYRDRFAPRCAHVLGHTGQPGANDLNGPCYVFWDIFPYSLWDDRKEGNQFFAKAVEVMADTLNSFNPACVEATLHGLGHFASIGKMPPR